MTLHHSPPSGGRRTGTRRFRINDWYSVSLDTIRGSLGFVLVVALGLAALVGYQQWSEHWVEQSALEWVSRAEGLLPQIPADRRAGPQADRLRSAEERLREARSALEGGQFRSAAALARSSYDEMQAVLSGSRSAESIAWFRSVRGDVRYRRGETGEFVRAYPRVELREGDYVRCGDRASAEIHFTNDETVFTLRPGSLIKLSRRNAGSQRTLAHMEYGWVSMDTARAHSGVTTERSEVFVDGNSHASLELEPAARRATLRVDQGAAEVKATGSGETRRLSERQAVTQEGDRLGRTRSLLPSPALVEPDDGSNVNLDNTDRIRLAWQPVSGARSYRVQVSRSRLFEDNLLEVPARYSTSMVLGLREQGAFLWRVAAIDGSGNEGPWSDPRRIRVDSYRNLAIDPDEEPPDIDVDIVMSGSVAILQGRTEPGATLTLDGEPIQVDADGSFAGTRKVYGSGRIGLLLRAVDGAGNVTEERRWVYLDDQ